MQIPQTASWQCHEDKAVKSHVHLWLNVTSETDAPRWCSNSEPAFLGRRFPDQFCFAQMMHEVHNKVRVSCID